ncbi:MAG: hypothetical protein H8E71_06780 [Candidatus Marinimicrobia bacterium]|nr:hypothetical protein [Candidatus Neomarinimicrobiota bacterium]MBL7109343.1 hypothetical protein [Candidatus Neomarinimicrobiota bacterium]
MIKVFNRSLMIIVFSLFIIFAVLYNFENESLLLKYGNSTILAYLKWCKETIFYHWGNLDSGPKLTLFQGDRHTVGVLSTVSYTFFYGISGLLLAFTLSTVLTYKTIFDHSTTAKVISGFFNFLSGIHIIFFCFAIKYVLGHDAGFHVYILIAIAIGSYTYSDICQFQTSQFHKLQSTDFIIAARSWGDSVFKHARRSIALGLLSQWNSLVGIVFASTIIVEYYYKIHGIGHAIHRYFAKPILKYSTKPVESEFFMIISALVIIIVVIMSGIKEMIYEKLSKTQQ